MKTHNFLDNLQYGLCRNGFFFGKRSGKKYVNRRLNFDDTLSKLVVWQNDCHSTNAQLFESPPIACKFRTDDKLDILAVANEDGEILVYDTNGKGRIKDFTAHHNAIFDICWVPGMNQLVTASGDHRAYLIDMETCKLISAYKGHKQSVKSVNVCPNQNTLIATGSKDGNICVWDSRQKNDYRLESEKPSILIEPFHIRSGASSSKWKSSLCYLSSVSAVCFQDENHLVSAGVADGILKVWDLRKTYVSKKGHSHSPRYQFKYSNASDGITSMMFDSNRKKLYACCTSHHILQFNCHTYENEVAAAYSGFMCKTYFVKASLSSDDQYLLAGSSTCKAYVWKTDKPGLPILELPGHKFEVTAVAWSPYDMSKLVTCGDDSRVFIWRTKDEDDIECHALDRTVYSAAVPFTVKSSLSPTDQSDKDPFEPLYQRPENHNYFSPAYSRSAKKLSKTPTTKSITNFFSPVPSSSSSSRESVSPDPTSPDSCLTSVSQVLRSPCKTLSGNEAATDAVAEGSSSSASKSSLTGKENVSASAASESVEMKEKSIVQVKRKLSDTPSRACKYHKICGRTRGHSRCGLKIGIPPPDKHNIKNYFCVVSPE